MRAAESLRLAHGGWILALCLAVAGCSFSSSADDCESKEEYQQARVAQDIVVPPGLDKPDEAGKLHIPDGPPPDGSLSANAACLQRPPDYFDKPLHSTAN